jgi:hypothetical protein
MKKKNPYKFKKKGPMCMKNVAAWIFFAKQEVRESRS